MAYKLSQRQHCRPQSALGSHECSCGSWLFQRPSESPHHCLPTSPLRSVWPRPRCSPALPGAGLCLCASASVNLTERLLQTSRKHPPLGPKSGPDSFENERQSSYRQSDSPSLVRSDKVVRRRVPERQPWSPGDRAADVGPVAMRLSCAGSSQRQPRALHASDCRLASGQHQAVAPKSTLVPKPGSGSRAEPFGREMSTGPALLVLDAQWNPG